jgi:hypothetical protein
MLTVSMLLPHPHDRPSQTVRDRQTIQNLRLLVNRAAGQNRILEKERDIARWQVILDRKQDRRPPGRERVAACGAGGPAGEIEELREAGSSALIVKS